MTQQSGNKAIAGFMDWNYPDLQKFIRDSGYHNYHESWNKLMPVVEKIESLGYDVSINTSYVDIMKYNEGGGMTQVACGEGKGSKINNTLDAVIQFITYYNSINKTT